MFSNDYSSTISCSKYFSLDKVIVVLGLGYMTHAMGAVEWLYGKIRLFE